MIIAAFFFLLHGASFTALAAVLCTGTHCEDTSYMPRLCTQRTVPGTGTVLPKQGKPQVTFTITSTVPAGSDVLFAVRMEANFVITNETITFVAADCPNPIFTQKMVAAAESKRDYEIKLSKPCTGVVYLSATDYYCGAAKSNIDVKKVHLDTTAFEDGVCPPYRCGLHPTVNLACTDEPTLDVMWSTTSTGKCVPKSVIVKVGHTRVDKANAIIELLSTHESDVSTKTVPFSDGKAQLKTVNSRAAVLRACLIYGDFDEERLGHDLHRASRTTKEISC